MHFADAVSRDAAARALRSTPTIAISSSTQRTSKTRTGRDGRRPTSERSASAASSSRRRWDLPAAAPEVVVIIEPSRGFGTGHHQSTRLCLALLQTRELEGRRVIDVGTGSGVLAIASALLGAPYVTAIDVDPDAVENARENAVRNGVAESVEIHIARSLHGRALYRPTSYRQPYGLASGASRRGSDEIGEARRNTDRRWIHHRRTRSRSGCLRRASDGSETAEESGSGIGVCFHIRSRSIPQHAYRAASAASATVSARSVSGPSVAETNPSPTASATSAGDQPPSGPTTM